MNGARKILIIEDDLNFQNTLADLLQQHMEVKVDCVPNAIDGLNHVQRQHVDLIILDVGLPDMDGRETCKLLRKDGFKGPIIILTSYDTDADIILGLDSGANDYIGKPCSFPVLLAHVRAQFRLHEQSEDATFVIGSYIFQPAMKILVDENGSKTRLNEKETALLRYFCRSGRKGVNRDVLLRDVWGYHPNATTHTVESHVYRLRQKIEKNPSDAALLLTCDDGYKLQI